MADDALRKLETIKAAFWHETPPIPILNCWRERDDASIWTCIMKEIMAVGKSEPADRFGRDASLQAKLSVPVLKTFADEDDRLVAINGVLRTAGIRYASSDPAKCWKSRSISKNFQVVCRAGGSRAFLESVSDLKGDQEKITCVRKTLKGFGSKTARAFLTELGMLQNSLAFDSRLTAILSKIGVELDSRYESNETVYAREEQRLLSSFCTPLGMKAVEFDQLLYQNYQRILESLE